MTSRPSGPPQPRPSRSSAGRPAPRGGASRRGGQGGSRTRTPRPGARPLGSAAGSSARGAGRPAPAGTRPAQGRSRGPGRGLGPAAPPRPRFTGRAAILVLVMAVLTVSYASSLRAYLEQRDHLSALHADIDQSQANIEALEREKERWEDPAFVRTQARLRFGWVLPGEIGFQVIDEDGKPLDHDDSLEAPVTEEASRPMWWQSAWRSVEAAGNPEEEADEPAPARRILAPRSPQR